MGDRGIRRRVEGAIFDLDGTLVDSEPLYAESDGPFLARFGIDLGEEGKYRYVGIGTRDFFRELELAYPESPLGALPLAERIRLKDLAFMEMASGRLKAFPAVLELARELGRRGLRLAVASGSSPQVIEAELDAIGARALFPTIVSSSEVPRGKPDPAIFLEAARRIRLVPSACLVIEDSVHGVAAARAAGMRCVALPASGSGGGAFEAADHLVPGGAAALDLREILGLIEAWNGEARA